MKEFLLIILSLLFLHQQFTIVVADPAYGLYHGPAPYSPANFESYEEWIGRPVSYGLDFMADDNWSSLEGGGWQLGPWSDWVNAAPNRYFVLSIPMVPSGGADQIVPGAQGQHNATWQALGKNLLAYNLKNVVLRIGWEMNGGWYPWSAAPNTTAWVKYFQVIVENIRSSYSGWKVLWNPNCGWLQIEAPVVWPGDDYVDYVGIDCYDSNWNSYPSYNLNLNQRGTWNVDASYNLSDVVDWQGAYYKALVASKGLQPPSPNNSDANWALAIDPTQLLTDRKSAWLDYYSGSYGLLSWTDFARNHSKQVVIPEWGVWLEPSGHGGGDNPYYIEQFYNYLYNASNNVAYYSYFDIYAFDGDHHLAPSNDSLPTLPVSAAKYQELFGGK